VRVRSFTDRLFEWTSCTPFMVPCRNRASPTLRGHPFMTSKRKSSFLPPRMSTCVHMSLTPLLCGRPHAVRKNYPFSRKFSDFGYLAGKFSRFHLPKFLMTFFSPFHKKFYFTRKSRKLFNSLWTSTCARPLPRPQASTLA